MGHRPPQGLARAGLTIGAPASPPSNCQMKRRPHPTQSRPVHMNQSIPTFCQIGKDGIFRRAAGFEPLACGAVRRRRLTAGLLTGFPAGTARQCPWQAGPCPRRTEGLPTRCPRPRGQQLRRVTPCHDPSAVTDREAGVTRCTDEAARLGCKDLAEATASGFRKRPSRGQARSGQRPSSALVATVWAVPRLLLAQGSGCDLPPELGTHLVWKHRYNDV